MDAMGTITQYFPFIDAETKEILEKIMNEASDYYDFVIKLVDHVLSHDSPVMVVYFAIQYSMIAFEFKSFDKIQEKYGNHKILKPNLFFASAHRGNFEDIKNVYKVANEILSTEPEDWIALEMNFMIFEADMREYPRTMYQMATMENIRRLIDSDKRFGFYEIILNDHMSIQAQVDGDTEERFRCLDRGIEFAEKFDDRLRKAHLLIQKGYMYMNYDRKKSRIALEEAYQIVESSLGIPSNYARIIYYLSLLDATRGEYDKAIEGCLKAVTVLERAGLDSGNPASFLSIFYNIVGDSESGLEWARMTEDQFKGRPYLKYHAVLFQIWSLILLKRLTEAQSILDNSRGDILKSGNEDQLAWYHFVSGLLEMERGELALALSTIEEGLKIYEQQGSALLMENIFLHQLAKIEIAACTTEVFSPSLAILEERALSEDLPGVLGQTMILKANIAILNNDDSILREVIPHIQSHIETHHLDFLKSSFESLQKHL